MQSISVTLTSVATPIIRKGVQPANSKPFQTIVVQNNADNVVRFGDSTVSATKGIQITSTGSSPSSVPWLILSPALEYTSDVYDFYLFGTAGDVIDIFILD